MQQLSQFGNTMETGLMIMKREAVLKFATKFPVRESMTFGPDGQIAVEAQISLLFEDDWYLMLPEVLRIRRPLPGEVGHTQSTFKDFFKMTDEEFLNLPIIFGANKHCSKELLYQWKLHHPIALHYCI